MKRIVMLITYFLVESFCISCDKYPIEEAEERFIENVQYMTERESLSHEIDYYKPPQITVARKVQDLSGKDAIRECNIMLRENEEESEALRSGRIQFGRIWYVDDEKEYALDHPNDIVGVKYYFRNIYSL